MSDSLRRHYQDLFRKHGDAAQSVQHFDDVSQRNRFRVLSEFALELGSVVDVGCGLGHFYDCLKEQGFAGRYLGLDFVTEFIEHAGRKHAGSNAAQFQVFDMKRNPYPEGYDTYVICGVFNNRLPDSETFLQETLTKVFEAARKGVAFNALSTYVNYQDEDLFYADPLKVFDFCKRKLTKRVVLRHDYLVRDDRLPYEYAVYLYK